MPKIQNLPFLLDVTPHQKIKSSRSLFDHRLHIEKKYFQQLLDKYFSKNIVGGAHFKFHNHNSIISPSSKKMAHFPHQKNLLHQIAIFMQSLNTSFIYSCSHCCCIISFTSSFMYTYILLTLIIQWLLNLIFSMTKVLNS